MDNNTPEKEEDRLPGEPTIDFSAYLKLPALPVVGCAGVEALRARFRAVCELAEILLPDSFERACGLRHLVESKDWIERAIQLKNGKAW